MKDFTNYNYFGNVVNGIFPYDFRDTTSAMEEFSYGGVRVNATWINGNNMQFTGSNKSAFISLDKPINLNNDSDFYIAFQGVEKTHFLNVWYGYDMSLQQFRCVWQLSDTHAYNSAYRTHTMTYTTRCFITISDNYAFFGNMRGDDLTVGQCQGYRLSDFANVLGAIVTYEYSESFGTMSSEQGYENGTFDDTSDTIPIPNTPTIGYISTGGFAYKLASGELNSLVNEIFVPYTPIESGDTGLEKIGIMLENVALTLQQVLNSQFVQYVTDVHVVPVSPSVGNRTQIKLGSRTMSTTSTPITSDFVTVDCGTLNIKEYYANFIDYVGTVCKLYLPFIGFVDVKNEWFQGGYLNVTYIFNVIDGTFMAFLKATSSKSNLNSTVVASYGGSCCVHLPFVGTDYSNVLSGLVSTVNGASSIVGSGDIGGAVSSATQLLSSLSGNVNGSNNYNSNSAFLGIRTPYLYIERIVSDFSETYAKENGLPLNVSYKISDLQGYTEIEQIHLDNVNCTEEEKNELLQLLQNGVIC